MAKKKPRRIIILWLFRILSFFIFLLPLRIGLVLGKYLGRCSYFVFKKEVRLALANLDLAFGDSKSLREKNVIVKELFENLGKNFIEIVNLIKFNKVNIDSYISCKGLDVIDNALKTGKGGIVISAHFGNWELMAHYFAIKGYRVNVIARHMREEVFEDFLKKIRKRHLVNVIYRDASAKEAVGLLRNNEFVGIMVDQDIDAVSGVFVDFFGKKAYTPDGPAVLNSLTGAPLIPCFIVRRDFGHEIFVEGPIELVDTLDRSRDIVENTQRYTKVVESYIRRFPSLWVWFHRRWKTQSRYTVEVAD